MREQLADHTDMPPAKAVAALQELLELSPLLTPPAAPPSAPPAAAAAAAATATAATTATVSIAASAAAADPAVPLAPLSASEAWRVRASELLSWLPHNAALAVCHMGKLHLQVRVRLRVGARVGAAVRVWC